MFLDVQVPSQEERAKNVDAAKKIERGEFSIQSLKDHCRFINSLVDLESISPS